MIDAGNGHVFVTRGDITKLCCDAWLLPTDASVCITQAWIEAAKRSDTAELPIRKPLKWDDDNRADALRPWYPNPNEAPAPIPILTNTGGTASTAAHWYAESIRQFVAKAREAIAKPCNWRSRPLLAVPFIGSGAGGKGQSAGSHVADVLNALRKEAVGLDIALVLDKPMQYSAAQSCRNDNDWLDLPERFKTLADDLAIKAKRGDLVVFLGAGASSSAGLPAWKKLLDALAERAAFTSEERKLIAELPALDAATVIESRLGERVFKNEIAKLLENPTYGLVHALLASLGVRETVTTNYDVLYETAYRDCNAQLSVLPHQPDAEATAWLLKYHGCITKSEDIVISRRDYLRYQATRSALFGIVQAMLITRHILFLGFSLMDDNFFAIIDEVRRAIDGDAQVPRKRAEFGTAILQFEKPFSNEIWKNDLRISAALDRTESDRLLGALRIEFFLDYLAFKAHDASAHILDANYANGLSDDDIQVRNALLTLKETLPADQSRHRSIRTLLMKYGA